MLLARLSAGFQSLPPLPTNKLGPSGADSLVGGFVYVLGPCGLSNVLSCEAGSFSCHHKPHRIFHSEVLRFYFTTLEPWIVWSVSLPSWSFRFIHMQMWDHLVQQPLPCCESSLPSCPSAPLLLVWMNVSSLTPQVLDFHKVLFSGNSD